jgi:flavin-dependent dehydrogenase
MVADRKYKIAIVGAGPAGSSLAIRLAVAGFETVLIERERFPRHKLCGEFISPECLRYFRELDVYDSMLSAGGDRITETRFFEKGGKSIAVPSGWFGEGGYALGLSRAEMDHRLLVRAKDAGVAVLEGTTVMRIDTAGGRVEKIVARSNDGRAIEIAADIFVDATGRAAALGKLFERRDAPRGSGSAKPAFVGFKAHIAGADLQKGICEIYSFPGGYAGLSHVEGGLANLCFLIRSETARSMPGGANEIVERVIVRNRRAAAALKNFAATDRWLAVSVTGFGTKQLAPAQNLFSVGDAASFIDPFTGSGMVMALESAEVLAAVIAGGHAAPSMLKSEYERVYRRRFANRLWFCSLLRLTAFMPRLATAVVYSLGLSSAARQVFARATRR